jgi:hypothetical protein
MRVGRRRSTGAACFALLALIAELTGRSLTVSLDRALHVGPLTAPSTPYYPFVLAGVRVVAAVALAAVAWRLVRAHGTAVAADTLLRTIGHRHLRAPRLRFRLTARGWLISFGATALWYLAQNDAERLSQGRWPVLAPWLHTYALPVFAVVAVLLALGWGLVRDWLAEIEHYAASVLARAFRVLRTSGVAPPRQRPGDDRTPRRLFGLVFESRPPPLAA